MTSKKQIPLILILIFVGAVYVTRSAIMPFIISILSAYFLNPLVNKLHKKYNLSRISSVLTIVLSFVIVITFITITLLPVITNQLITLLQSLPNYFYILIGKIAPQINEIITKFGIEPESNLLDLLHNGKIVSHAVNLAGNILNNAINSSAAIVNILSIIFLTPVLIFYLLKDWEVLTKQLNSNLPTSVSLSVKKIFNDINHNLSAYIHGQFIVCIILASIYATLLAFSGLNFGFLIGFLTGFFVFVPYIGMLCGVTAATIVGLAQWGFDPTKIAIIAAIFIFGQLVESNFLTPKLIGDKIGIHPVLIIFGLFVFGSLFGITGVLFAVPLTAVSGVLIKHLLSEYRDQIS